MVLLWKALKPGVGSVCWGGSSGLEGGWAIAVQESVWWSKLLTSHADPH